MALSKALKVFKYVYIKVWVKKHYTCLSKIKSFPNDFFKLKVNFQLTLLYSPSFFLNPNKSQSLSLRMETEQVWEGLQNA